MSENNTRTEEPRFPEVSTQQEGVQKLAGTPANLFRLRSHSSHRLSRRGRDAGLFLLTLLCGVAAILALARIDPQREGSGNPLPAQPTQAVWPGASPPASTVVPLLSSPTFHEYAFPHSDSQVMRLAMDHQGQLWFGAMGQNTLMQFDPHTQLFQQITPPHGQAGIMGIQVTPDNTVWFTEMRGASIGRLDPRTGQVQVYALPWHGTAGVIMDERPAGLDRPGCRIERARPRHANPVTR